MLLAVLGFSDPFFGETTLLLVAPIKVVAMLETDLKMDCFLVFVFLLVRPPWRELFSLKDIVHVLVQVTPGQAAK